MNIKNFSANGISASRQLKRNPLRLYIPRFMMKSGKTQTSRRRKLKRPQKENMQSSELLNLQPIKRKKSSKLN